MSDRLRLGDDATGPNEECVGDRRLDRDAFVIPKNQYDAIAANGIEEFRKQLLALVPRLVERTNELRTFDDIKLLTVTIDRLREWARPGLRCIGDAAHAMSPIGGVGINLAVQDAVAAANRL